LSQFEFDVLIIGSGPGGYVAAIRSAQLGLKTALIEKNELGGVCLNWGCIPSKSLLRSAEILNLIKESNEHGIYVSDLKSDFGQAVNRSRKIVKKLTDGIGFLLKKNNVELISGNCRITSQNQVEILETKQKINSKNILIATGAKFKDIPNLPIDEKIILNSKNALGIEKSPNKAVIIGAGATGVEFSYMWNAFGTNVTLVELQNQILPLEDAEISKQLSRSLIKQGIQIKTQTKVEKVTKTNSGAILELNSNGKISEIETDIVLVAVGMEGNVKNIGLEEVGISTNNNFIAIDENMMTNLKGVYAIGDVTGKTLLAHVASAQGIHAIEHIAGQSPEPIKYELMPRAIYSNPQVASFGMTEQQAIDQGSTVKVGKFPLSASGKAMALGHNEGMIKIVSESESGIILGAHMVGPEVTELLGELGIATMLESTEEELAMTVHPHPTISESIVEACLAINNEAIHM